MTRNLSIDDQEVMDSIELEDFKGYKKAEVYVELMTAGQAEVTTITLGKVIITSEFPNDTKFRLCMRLPSSYYTPLSEHNEKDQFIFTDNPILAGETTIPIKLGEVKKDTKDMKLKFIFTLQFWKDNKWTDVVDEIRYVLNKALKRIEREKKVKILEELLATVRKIIQAASEPSHQQFHNCNLE